MSMRDIDKAIVGREGVAFNTGFTKQQTQKKISKGSGRKKIIKLNLNIREKTKQTNKNKMKVF